MSNAEREHLMAEIHMLERMLDTVPEERVIHRKGFKARLCAARERLERLPAEEKCETVKLVFRGQPVVDSSGVFASFGSQAAFAFSEAVAAIREAIVGRLGDMGPIAGGDRSGLLITGTAKGSFGFEFAVPVKPDSPEHDDHTGFQLAITKLQDLFQNASSSQGENLADLVAEIHPRAVKKAREFLDMLYQNGAWCNLQYRDRPFGFRNVSEVKQTMDVLADENIREYECTIVGAIEGVLPTARLMEFRVEGQGGPVRVKIGRNIDSAEALKQFLDRRTQLRVQVTEVKSRKPRYELIALPPLLD